MFHFVLILFSLLCLICFQLLFVVALGVQAKPLFASQEFVEAFKRLLKTIWQRSVGSCRHRDFAIPMFERDVPLLRIGDAKTRYPYLVGNDRHPR